MSDTKGKTAKPRKFAPKRSGKKAGNDGADKAANATGPASATTNEADPFSALMVQARQASSKSNTGATRIKQEGKLQVAFSAGAADNRGKKGSANNASTSGHRGNSTLAGTRGSGGGAASAKTYKVLGDAKIEGKDTLEDDVQLPFLEEDAYYPTLLPFQKVDDLHDRDALSRPALPQDLAEQTERPEGNTADALGITGGSEATLLLQLPSVLPAVTLREAAERRAAEASGAVEPGTVVSQAPPAALSGPEIMHALPNGKVGSVAVTKKGKVRLKMGCCKFVVMPGVPQHCRQEIHVINVRTGDIVLVAEDCTSAVAALDMSDMIEQLAVAAKHDR